MGFVAEKEGFEPSRPFRSLHDFQSCALDQLGDFSIAVSSSRKLIHLTVLCDSVISISETGKKSSPFWSFSENFAFPIGAPHWNCHPAGAEM